MHMFPHNKTLAVFDQVQEPYFGWQPKIAKQEMVLLLHFPAGLQHEPNLLPAHVSCASSPHRPSVLTLRPPWFGGGVEVAM